MFSSHWGIRSASVRSIPKWGIDSDDEDTSLVEQAEERADRFVDYKDKRISDAERAHEAISRIADNIPLGHQLAGIPDPSEHTGGNLLVE